MVLVDFSQILKGCAILDGILQIFYILSIIILRIYTGANETIPSWIETLNTNNFKKGLTDMSGTGFLFVLLYCALFIIPKFFGAVFLWISADQKNRKILPKWIVATTALCIIGLLLLIPMCRNDVYEYGISFIFTIISTIVSFPTILVAAAYFFTQAFDETELIDC